MPLLTKGSESVAPHLLEVVLQGDVEVEGVGPVGKADADESLPPGVILDQKN